MFSIMRKIILMLVLFSFEVNADNIPSHILQKLNSVGINSKSIIFMIDSKDCISCTAQFYKTLSIINKNFPNNFYFFSKTIIEANDLDYFLISQDFLIPKEKLIVNAELGDWFKKKSKSNNAIIKINDNSYSFLDNSADLSIKSLSYLAKNYSYTPLDTIIFNANFLPTSSNIIEVDTSNIYILNNHSNNFYILNINSKKTSALYLDSLLDKSKILNSLNLNNIDYELTVSNNLNSKILGEKFLNYVNFDIVNNKIFFSLYVKYTHQLSQKELNTMKQTLEKKLIKQLSKDTVVETDKVSFFVVSVDENYNLSNVLLTDTISNTHSIDGYSGLSKENNSNNYFFNILFNNTYINPKSYNNTNYVTAIFQNNNLNNKLLFKEFSNITRPAWYGKMKVYGNYSNGKFQIINNKNYFYLYSYPFFTDISKSIKYEMPEEQLSILNKKRNNNFLKKVRPAYYSLGLLDLSENEIGLMITSFNTGNVYTCLFNKNGDFINYTYNTKSNAWVTRYLNNKLHMVWFENENNNKNIILIRAKYQ